MGEPARVSRLSPLEQQFEDLRERYPGASLLQGGGIAVVSVPAIRLPGGWNREAVAVHFIVPPGYPNANPDCFNVDPDLRLAGGAIPKNAALQEMPLVGPTLWFSWHLQRAWKPGRDTLLTWLGAILHRFDARS